LAPAILLPLVPEINFMSFCFHRTLMKVMDTISVSGTSAISSTSQVAKPICALHLDLHGILRASSTCFLALDAEGKICEWSSPLATLLGFTQDEICGSLFFDLVSNDVHDVLLDIIDNALTLCQWKSTAIQLYTKDSHKQNVMLHAIPRGFNDRLYFVVQPTPHEGCHPDGLSAVVRLPSFDVDTSNKITMWSINMTEFSGFTANDVMGLSLFDFFEQDTLPNVQNMVTRSQEEAGPSTCRVCFYTIAGIPRMVELNATAFQDTPGQVIVISIVIKHMVEDEGTSPLLAQISSSDSSDDMLSCTSDESDAEL